MAMKTPIEKSPSLKTWCTLALSTNADGITGSDVADIGGLSVVGMEFNSLSTDANYSFKGGLDSTNLQTLLNTTGDVITIGSTAAGAMSGKTVIFDPSKFAGIRYIQVVSGTTAVPIANATGATCTLFLGLLGPNK